MINSGRRTLSGCAVGKGWVQGQIRCLDDLNDGVVMHHLKPHQMDAEVDAFDAAVLAVVERIRAVLVRLDSSERFIAEGGDVLRAHVSIAEDPDLRTRVVAMLRDNQINSAWALERVAEEIQIEFGALDDPYIASRMLDIRQVFHRLQRELAGGQIPESTIPKLRPDEILLARDLEPVLALGILEQKPIAIITEEGSATSHLALLCRAMRVPAMVGVKNATESLVAGDEVLIDLQQGILVRDPDRRDVAMAQVHLVESELHLADPKLPAVTLDGVRVQLLANLDTTSALTDAVAEGAEGIGLFRSEYLLLRHEQPDDQKTVYERILGQISGPVTVRTFDIGSDKLPLGRNWEPNPALGLRALRSYQADPKDFRAQLRILMRVAGSGARLQILLPMVDSLDEEAEIRFQQGTNSLDISVSNDGGFFQRIVFSNGRLFRKYQNGNYVAGKDLDSKRLYHADQAFALGATGWDLIGRLLALKPSANQQIAGRACSCYDLRKAAAPVAFDNRSLKGAFKDLKGWRAGLTLDTIKGNLCLDNQTGVPLRVEMNARATRALKDGQGELVIKLLSEFTGVGKAPPINAPEEFLDTLRRTRRDRPGTTFLRDKGIKVLERPDAGIKPPN